MQLFRGQVAGEVNSRTLARVGIAAALACIAVFSMSSPALADPQPYNPVEYPTAGWSGQWQFSGPHAWSLTMNMPGTVVAITGWDEDNSRYFSGTITDTTSVNRCSTIRFYEGGGMAYYTACDGTVSFSQFDNTPGTYDFELNQLGDYHEGTNQNLWNAVSYLTVPSTKYHAELRAAGTGASWSYVSASQVNYWIVRPGGSVFGSANGDGTGPRSTTATIYAAECTRTSIADSGNTVVATKDVCAGQSPGTISASNFGGYHGFEVKNCVVRSQVLVVGGGTTVGRPGPQHCIPLTVR